MAEIGPLANNRSLEHYHVISFGRTLDVAIKTGSPAIRATGAFIAAPVLDFVSESIQGWKDKAADSRLLEDFHIDRS